MSMWIYLQGMKPSDLPRDLAAVEALFDVEFDELRQRVRAGRAVWLERGFFELNEIYRPRSEPDGDRELPVFGGRHIPDPGGGPGHVVLEPAEVARAAVYLEGASFSDLCLEWWSQLPPSEQDEELREHLTQCHGDLRSFYGRSAEQGRAVVKYFSF
ncbi:hypothetical protein ACIF8T_24450 [Streptomyces sp. NPDC085946]|uniref:hypothetical protein n=1 Tax=Streptomyces sp. NPDC085946 TaxID=3365744 RepID=UPI0037D6F1A1